MLPTCYSISHIRNIIARYVHVIARPVYDVAGYEHTIAEHKHAIAHSRNRIRRPVIVMQVLAIVCMIPVFAQHDPMDTLITRRNIFPPDVALNISYLIPEHHAKGNADTVKLLMAYWERHCGMSEELMRCRILFAIEDGSYSEQVYRNTDIIQLLRDYEQHIPVYGNIKVMWSTSFESQYREQYGQRLNIFTAQLANRLLESKERPAEETFFLTVYANRCAYIAECMEQPSYGGTYIRKLYGIANPKPKPVRLLHWDVTAGAWIPDGSLALLGVHPNIGFRMGANRKKWTTDFSLHVSFAESPNTYTVEFENELYDTNDFARVYLGLDLAYELLRLGRHSLSLAGGAGFDGIQCLNFGDDGDEETPDTKWIITLSRNIGLVYKFYYKDRRYIGIEGKFNGVNYANTNGTSLYGNVCTIGVLWGNSINM